MIANYHSLISIHNELRHYMHDSLTLHIHPSTVIHSQIAVFIVFIVFIVKRFTTVYPSTQYLRFVKIFTGDLKIKLCRMNKKF